MLTWRENQDGIEGYDGTILKISGEEDDVTGPIPEKDAEEIESQLFDGTASSVYYDEEYPYTDTGTPCRGMMNITDVEMCYTEIKKISPYAFADCASLTFVAFPDTLEEIGEYAFDRCPLKYQLLCFPRTLKRIGANAFRECFNLQRINVPADCVVEGEQDGYLPIGQLFVKPYGQNDVVPAEILVKVTRYDD